MCFGCSAGWTDCRSRALEDCSMPIRVLNRVGRLDIYLKQCKFKFITGIESEVCEVKEAPTLVLEVG
jgi:hypothetical protein